MVGRKQLDKETKVSFISTLMFGGIIAFLVLIIILIRFFVNNNPKCLSGEILDKGQCYPLQVSCGVSFGKGNSTYVKGQGYSECRPLSCDKWYKIDGNKCISNIPTEPRAYIDFMLQNGSGGEDYVIVEPAKPRPEISASTASENNKRIMNYIIKNVKNNTIKLPTGVVDGYIMFSTTKEIGKENDLFLVISDANKGMVDKDKSLDPYSTNEYVYDINAIPQISSVSKRAFITNLLNNVVGNKISITGIVGEKGNRVEKITIVFKR
ncbi:MAG: hypothetical protein NT085_00275 [candidate division SR1 bacterium]|nr:hypothetical protein [candidate division SR1 bacterium]